MMYKHSRGLLSLLALMLLLLMQERGYSQNEWNLRSDKDDIHAYTRKIENAKILEYRIEAEMEGTVPAALNLMRDLSLYKKLFPYTSDLKILHQESENDFHLYLTVNTPFPAKNRDGTYHNVITINPDQTKARIDISISDRGDHIENNNVRLKKGYGFWEFTQIDQTKLKVVHQFYTDPEGTVPKWLINNFIIKNPIKSIENMKKLILQYPSSALIQSKSEK